MSGWLFGLGGVVRLFLVDGEIGGGSR